MLKRLIAVAFIFICTSLAWLFLGGTIVARTGSTDGRLRGSIQTVWGSPQVQKAPGASYEDAVIVQETLVEGGHSRTVEHVNFVTKSIVPSASEVNVNLGLEHRQKGLLWYSTYRVGFAGDYEFHNPDSKPRRVRFTLPFPAASARYDGLQFQLNGRAVSPVIANDAAWTEADLNGGENARLHVAYNSQGLDSWTYSFGENVRSVETFHLRMNTNFKDIDFPDNTLSPTMKRPGVGGWQLDWNFSQLLSGYQIAMQMPAKLQPGPLASEISFFAPVSLFFFFFVMLTLSATRGIQLHPMHYFFLAAAFFAFHLLLAYLVDHIDIYAAFTIASLVSVTLVVTYLRLVIGTRFALREAAIAQFLYLVLFSFAFFFKGFTGLAITAGAIVTLFVAMQMTARVRWQEVFAGRPQTA